MTRVAVFGTSVCYRDDWLLERGRSIDYVMVRRGDYGPTLDITACKRIFDKPVDGVWASDQFGVVADLAVPTPRSTSAYS